MPLVLSFLLLAGVAQPSVPDPKSCEWPGPDDDRPYTLCLAETRFDQAEASLNAQWQTTLAYTRAQGGAATERRVRNEQRRWLRARDRECAAFARSTPVTQTSRNQLNCSAQLDERRTAYLRRLAGQK